MFVLSDGKYVCDNTAGGSWKPVPYTCGIPMTVFKFLPSCLLLTNLNVIAMPCKSQGTSFILGEVFPGDEGLGTWEITVYINQQLTCFLKPWEEAPN